MNNVYEIKKNQQSSMRGKYRPLDSILSIRDAALTGYLIQALHEQNVPLTQNVINKLYEAANKFQTTPAAEHFFNEAVQRRSPTSPSP